MILTLAGCATDTRVRAVSPDVALREQTNTRLTGDALSKLSRDGLDQLQLQDLRARDPLDAVDRLVVLAEEEPDGPWLVIAAEVLFDQAESERRRDLSLYLKTAQLADREIERAVRRGGGLLDSRTEFAADLYRRCVAVFLTCSEQVWLGGAAEAVEGSGGRFTVRLQPAQDRRQWAGSMFDRLIPTDFVGIQGMSHHHRLDAFGAPATAVRQQADAEPPRAERFIPPEGLMAATTVTLRFDAADAVVVELWNPDHAPTIERYGAVFRLSSDVSVPVAELYARAELASRGRLATRLVERELSRAGIYFHEPYDPSKTPVLMVHGLQSSPATWRDLLNDLRADPTLRERYQFWMFFYPSGLPIARSAAYLRRELKDVRAYLDPTGQKPGLQDMVLVGHSMGGLVSKAVVQDSGDRLWASLHPKPFDEVEMPDDVRDHLREVFFYEADEGVGRVVFIATPHGGSKIAKSWIGRAGDKLIRLPGELISVGEWMRDESRRLSADPSFQLARGVPSSIDDLQEDAPHLVAYREMQMRDELPYHLIAGKKDWVVSLESALLPGGESELVVEAGHNAHAHPLAIREVRRILLEHHRQRASTAASTAE
ncbi:MAG: alpha/beta fold hydrolase [Planctomycetota bacterium]